MGQKKEESKKQKNTQRQELKLWIYDAVLLYGVLAIVQTLYYIVSVAKGYYHADCTDSLFWAQATYDAGALVNPDFNYAGLMAFAGNIIMLPGVALFGVGLKAQIMGMVIFYILLVLGLAWLGRQLGFSYRWNAVLIGSVSLWMSSSEKLREIFWEHIIYYSFGFMLLTYILAAVLWMRKKCGKSNSNGESKAVEKISFSLKSLKAVSKGKLIALLLVFGLAVISAMNGFQLVVMSVLPVLGAIVIIIFMDVQANWKDGVNCIRYSSCGVLLIGTVVGLVLGKLSADGVEAGYENAYSVYSNPDEWMQHLTDLYPAFLKLTGARGGSELSMFSVEGIANLLRILCVTVVLVIPFVMLLNWKHLLKESERLVLVSHFVCSGVIVLGWVFGLLNSAPWRLSPVLATSVVCSVVFAKQIYRNAIYKRFLVFVVGPVLVMSLLVSVELKTMDKQSVANENLTEVAEFLEDNELEYGYATFWQANIVTMLTDSAVEVRNVEFVNNELEQCYYQSNDFWYEDVDEYDRYFVLLTNGEYNEWGASVSLLQNATEQLQCGEYTILVYDYNIFSPETAEGES